MRKEITEEVRNNMEIDMDLMEQEDCRGGAFKGMLFAFAIEVWFAALIFLVAYFISMLG